MQLIFELLLMIWLGYNVKQLSAQKMGFSGAQINTQPKIGIIVKLQTKIYLKMVPFTYAYHIYYKNLRKVEFIVKFRGIKSNIVGSTSTKDSGYTWGSTSGGSHSWGSNSDSSLNRLCWLYSNDSSNRSRSSKIEFYKNIYTYIFLEWWILYLNWF